MKLLVALFALALLISCRSKPQRQEASAESRSETSGPTLAQQKLCAEQAKKAFDEYRQGGKLGGDEPMLDYTSHFDPQKNLCYVRINSTTMGKSGETISAIVYDAFERRVFASYAWVSYSGKKYWEVKPSECEVHPQQQPTVYCQSIEEFNDLVEKWFGVAQ